MMEPWAVYDSRDRLVYVGLHSDEASCWQVYLGWPSDDEIRTAKRNGFHAESVMLSRVRDRSEHDL